MRAASRGNVLSTVWCPLCVPSGVFPGCDVTALEEASLRARIAAICEQRMIVAAEEWTGKVLQLKQVRRANIPYHWFDGGGSLDRQTVGSMHEKKGE